MAGHVTSTSTATTSAPATGSVRRRIVSDDLIDFLQRKGFDFRLNQIDDALEVNGQRITDTIRSDMRTVLRDGGYGKYLAAAEDAVMQHAGRHSYHPVRDFFAGLRYGGGQHIAEAAQYVTDVDGVFELYFRRWMIGAVARVHTGVQNACLVLDGEQGIGKSEFCRWACPLPEFYLESSINPDDKDHSLLAIRSLVWEVSELGATTRRADVEALKAFLSRQVFTVRQPYGHFEIRKPALASFVGTANNSAGIFSDPTGSRRFWATTLTGIDWAYSQLDVHELWAEAHAAYLAGERWTLTADEAKAAAAINQGLEVEEPLEDYLRSCFTLDPTCSSKWTATVEILTRLQDAGLQGQTRANSMQLAATMRRLGHEKRSNAAKVRGYVGVW